MAGEWWSGVELRHLVALDAVAREGSFRRAATRLGYVQSAISHQIAALENLTGKRLIERSRGTRPLALTAAGEILLAHADAVIARVRAAQADLAALDGNGNAALRVGATPDLLARLVPLLLRVYGAPVTLNEISSTTALLAALVGGELDPALAETIAADERRQETHVAELADGVVSSRSIAAVWSRLQPLSRDAASFVEAARAACATERLREPSIA